MAIDITSPGASEADLKAWLKTLVGLREPLTPWPPTSATLALDFLARRYWCGGSIALDAAVSDALVDSLGLALRLEAAVPELIGAAFAAANTEATYVLQGIISGPGDQDKAWLVLTNETPDTITSYFNIGFETYASMTANAFSDLREVESVYQGGYGAKFRAAVTFADGKLSMSVNGGATVTDTTAGVAIDPADIDHILLGGGTPGSSPGIEVPGHIQFFAAFPPQLDAALPALSALT